jgi:transposase
VGPGPVPTRPTAARAAGSGQCSPTGPTISLGWVIDGANRNDSILLEDTLAVVAARGLLADVDTLHLDRGYDSALTMTRCHDAGITDIICARKQKTTKSKRRRSHKAKTAAITPETPETTPTTVAVKTTKTKPRHSMGQRWPVERTNSWFSNFGQLRRNTDRDPEHRLAQIDLAVAVALIITVKLIKWAKRWND